VSSFELGGCGSWAGRPVARFIGEAVDRGRVLVSGTICKTATARLGFGTAYECVLEDSTGTLVLVFVGRERVPGMNVGASCMAEGTARSVNGRLEVWNPLYRLR
jgi:DNA/RNA endonuclease YhcR with UshA esterase domain